MSKYEVIIQTWVSTTVTVEAEAAEEAAENSWNTDRTLGLMFLDHKYPDVGEWYPVAVYDPDGEEVLGSEDLEEYRL